LLEPLLKGGRWGACDASRAHCIVTAKVAFWAAGTSARCTKYSLKHLSLQREHCCRFCGAGSPGCRGVSTGRPSSSLRYPRLRASSHSVSESYRARALPTAAAARHARCCGRPRETKANTSDWRTTAVGRDAAEPEKTAAEPTQPLPNLRSTSSRDGSPSLSPQLVSRFCRSVRENNGHAIPRRTWILPHAQVRGLVPTGSNLTGLFEARAQLMTSARLMVSWRRFMVRAKMGVCMCPGGCTELGPRWGFRLHIGSMRLRRYTNSGTMGPLARGRYEERGYKMLQASGPWP
jgi:hypothetical protein